MRESAAALQRRDSGKSIPTLKVCRPTPCSVFSLRVLKRSFRTEADISIKGEHWRIRAIGDVGQSDVSFCLQTYVEVFECDVRWSKSRKPGLDYLTTPTNINTT